MAAFFNRISNEFDPLVDEHIPASKPRVLSKLERHEVSTRLCKFRKPKSMVKGDLFPQLMTIFSDFLAIPLTDIYNEISVSYTWSSVWKQEFVTIIPKKASLAGLNDLRNISCTMLASKVYESYVLSWTLAEIKLKNNQFGDVKGCSTQHMLVELVQDVLEDLEDYRAGSVLVSIDYAKAFNRMSFQHCLAAFKKKGASAPIIRLIATFLTGRTMTVRVGSTWSEPRQVHGGCPQGSILGVLLFNTTTDDLEDGCEDVEQPAIDEEERDNSGGHVVAHSSPAPGFVALHENGCSLLPVVRGRKRPRRLLDPGEGSLPVPEEGNHWTEARWKRRKVRIKKYIDDGINTDKINFENSYGFNINGQPHRVKHAVPLQNVFRRVVRNAEGKGMRVNTLKTTLLCVSDASSYEPDSYIKDDDGNRIGKSDRAKILGFTMSNRPGVHAHYESVIKRFRQRPWVLRHLRNLGFTQSELVRVYSTVVRLVAEYCVAAFHPQLTDEQEEGLERLQDHALKIIFGAALSARKLSDAACIPTLRQRREELCLKFARKVAGSRFSYWFPKRQERTTRKNDTFKEFPARCARLYNSPLFI